MEYEEEDKQKNSKLYHGVKWLLQCINSRKPNVKHHLKYDSVRHYITSQLREAGHDYTKAINLAKQLHCPDKESVAPPPSVAPPSKVIPIKEENPDDKLLSRFNRMKELSDLDVILKRGNPYKSIKDEVWKESIMETYDKIEAELDELGGELTKEEEAYVRTIPDAFMKAYKLKVIGKGRSKKCLKCGLLK